MTYEWSDSVTLEWILKSISADLCAQFTEVDVDAHSNVEITDNMQSIHIMM